ncbi:MAG: hypothetical protein KBF32_08720 [Chitinophagales bacterium]|nr:hypothetical protein [Chitinophagaceae bacterium]MBP9883473.1 hypothetical protein [Chitinophagales bacterium]
MIIVEIPVGDDLIQKLGEKQVEKLLLDELEYQRFKLLEEELQQAMKEAKGVDWEAAFEKTRQQAYDEWIERREKRNG